MTEYAPDKVFTVEIDAPIQRVWDEITKTESQNKPMFNTYRRGPMTPGSKYFCEDKNGKRVFTMGEIIEIDPPTRLVETFRFTWYDDEPTLVTWELSEPSAGKTKVVLTHAKLDPATKTHRDIQKGWPTILGLLKSVCEKGNVPAGTRMKYAMMGSMSFVLPKSTLAENAKARV